MLHTLKNCMLVLSLVGFFAHSAYAFFDQDEDVIWQADLNQYFKYAKQDSSKFGANDHPLSLNAKDIHLALKALQFSEKKLFSDPKIRPVFSSLQVSQLATHLATGLQQATPEQDIIFVMQGGNKALVVLTKRNFVAGRVFYKDGKLNIILGEYDRPRNDAFESVYDPSGERAVPYSFNYGRRKKVSKQFKGKIEQVDGFAYQSVDDKLRQDWLLIDIDVAAKAYVEKSKQAQQVADGNIGVVITDTVARETSKLAQQRREMRVEMARMRKEMRQLEARSVKQAPQERMSVLQDLLEQGLISQQEYDDKRQAVLDDL